MTTVNLFRVAVKATDGDLPTTTMTTEQVVKHLEAERDHAVKQLKAAREIAACRFNELDRQGVIIDELKAANKELDEQRWRAVRNQSSTCIYCGEEFGPFDRVTLDKHRCECAKHPMRAVEAELAEAKKMRDYHKSRVTPLRHALFEAKGEIEERKEAMTELRAELKQFKTGAAQGKSVVESAQSANARLTATLKQVRADNAAVSVANTRWVNECDRRRGDAEDALKQICYTLGRDDWKKLNAENKQRALDFVTGSTTPSDQLTATQKISLGLRIAEDAKRGEALYTIKDLVKKRPTENTRLMAENARISSALKRSSVEITRLNARHDHGIRYAEKQSSEIETGTEELAKLKDRLFRVENNLDQARAKYCRGCTVYADSKENIAAANKAKSGLVQACKAILALENYYTTVTSKTTTSYAKQLALGSWQAVVGTEVKPDFSSLCKFVRKMLT